MVAAGTEVTDLRSVAGQFVEDVEVYVESGLIGDGGNMEA